MEKLNFFKLIKRKPKKKRKRKNKKHATGFLSGENKKKKWKISLHEVWTVELNVVIYNIKKSKRSVERKKKKRH